MPVVGPARIYTGAHLPLDVAGGLAMGLATEAVCERLLDLPERRWHGSGPEQSHLQRTGVRCLGEDVVGLHHLADPEPVGDQPGGVQLSGASIVSSVGVE